MSIKVYKGGSYKMSSFIRRYNGSSWIDIAKPIFGSQTVRSESLTSFARLKPEYAFVPNLDSNDPNFILPSDGPFSYNMFEVRPHFMGGHNIEVIWYTCKYQESGVEYEASFGPVIGDRYRLLVWRTDNKTIVKDDVFWGIGVTRGLAAQHKGSLNIPAPAHNIQTDVYYLYYKE